MRHEAGNDPVKFEPVIEPFLDEQLDAFDMARREVRTQFNYDLTTL